MKKIFTLIVAAMMAAGAYAFTDTWKSTSTSTSPVQTANVKITFNQGGEGGVWTFSNSYAVGAENGQTITIEPTATGNFTIIFGGSVSTSKKIHMQDAAGNGLTAKLASNNSVTIDDNTSPSADIASNDGLVYELKANQVYTFSVSGTKWRLASYKFTNEKEIIYDTEWNFSTWEDESTGFTNQVKNNLGLFACYKNVEKQITNFGKINGSNKGGYKKRFQFGGGGSPLSGTGTPTQRFIYFNVNGDADIAIQFLSGSSDSKQTLYITDGTNILSQTEADGNLTEAKFSYSGNAGVIYIYGSGSINMYDIKANNVGTTVLLDDTTKPTGIKAINAEATAAPAVKKYVENGQVVIEKAGKKFTVAGAQLK